MQYFVTGINTGVGKTIVSAVLARALNAVYWKPVQSGDLDCSDSHTVSKLVPGISIVPESYRFARPIAPLFAADREQTTINPQQFVLPMVGSTPLVVEGAGGIYAPLTKTFLIADLIGQLKLPAIVVVKNYLGSINHTLLTIEGLQTRNIPIQGLIFNGDSDIDSERFIVEYSGLSVLGKIPPCKTLDAKTVATLAGTITLP